MYISKAINFKTIVYNLKPLRQEKESGEGAKFRADRLNDILLVCTPNRNGPTQKSQHAHFFVNDSRFKLESRGKKSVKKFLGIETTTTTTKLIPFVEIRKREGKSSQCAEVSVYVEEYRERVEIETTDLG